MKSFGKKLVAGLSMIASVALMTGCGNGSSSGTDASGIVGIYSAFGNSVACGQVAYGQVITAVTQTNLMTVNWQIFTDQTGTNIASACGTMQVNTTIYAGQCQVLPGTYSVGLLTTGLVQNSIQNTYYGPMVSMNFQAVPTGGYVSGNSYSFSMQAFMMSAGAYQTLGNGGIMVTNAMAPMSGAVSPYGGASPYGTTTLPCNDQQGEAL